MNCGLVIMPELCRFCLWLTQRVMEETLGRTVFLEPEPFVTWQLEER